MLWEFFPVVVILPAMNQTPSTPPELPPPRLLEALRGLLRPLVRLLIAHQLTYPLLLRILKSVYVEVAESAFSAGGAPLSDSRVNLLTGIHRKDIKRLRLEIQEPPEAARSAAAASLGARLVAAWLGSARYVENDGSPRALPLKTVDGEAPGFDTLVAEVCRGNIRPRVILDEWIQLGVARLDGDRVALNTGAFTPEKGFDEKLFFFGKNLRDHIAAGAENLAGGKAPHFDRSVYYNRLSPDSVAELKALANELGMEALTRLNRRAAALQRADSARNDAGHRINFGIFNYTARQGGPGQGTDSAAAQSGDEN